MGFVIVISVLALGLWSIFLTSQRLLRAHANRAWWCVFVVLSVAGLAAGCWLAFNFEYQVSPRTRCASFPLPLAFFRLEDGRWVDFVTPTYVMYPGLVANVVAIVAMALLPLWFASWASSRRHKVHDSQSV
ncbi:MAG: hypothetical protein EB141_01845 [Verrucomicrobia bacterium]|nr:hypothetical protein [Verrucomicrobiota bacterium]NBU09882.1 hypothetical protein [Pseudomonadota bacterium]NDA65102.1 hypothetical protein [Verrucomicrobiota bacterium]NDB74387.1 hypothetical protein [Verrucomicrobiota bacterium]NDD36978.1 hypothetical protein [Verrucomicrobiota bacterium]